MHSIASFFPLVFHSMELKTAILVFGNHAARKIPAELFSSLGGRYATTTAQDVLSIYCYRKARLQYCVSLPQF